MENCCIWAVNLLDKTLTNTTLVIIDMFFSQSFEWILWLVVNFDNLSELWMIPKICKADFGHIEEKFVELQRGMGFEINFISHELWLHYHIRIYRFPCNSEFYTMSNRWFLLIYEANMEFIKLKIMVTHCEDIASSLHYKFCRIHSISCNSANI